MPAEPREKSEKCEHGNEACPRESQKALPDHEIEDGEKGIPTTTPSTPNIQYSSVGSIVRLKSLQSRGWRPVRDTR